MMMVRMARRERYRSYDCEEGEEDEEEGSDKEEDGSTGSMTVAAMATNTRAKQHSATATAKEENWSVTRRRATEFFKKERGAIWRAELLCSIKLPCRTLVPCCLHCILLNIII